MNQKESDLVWAAGFVDGEGCFNAYFVKPTTPSARGYYHLTLSVGNTVRAPLEILQVLFGGSISPQVKKTGRAKDSWFWAVATKQARAAARQLHLHLRVKAPQAAVFMRWPLMAGGGGFKHVVRDEQDALSQELAVMNKRGK